MFDNLSEKLQQIIATTGKNSTLTDENIQDALREIRRALLGADVSLNVVKGFISSIKDKVIGEKVVESTNPSQTLIKIVALCPICHATIHYGRTCKIEGMAGAEKVMKHFCKVNNCSLEEFNEHVEEAKDLWVIRSEVNWKLDISKITDRGIIPLKMKGDIK